jgi:hypothetical protein
MTPARRLTVNTRSPLANATLRTVTSKSADRAACVAAFRQAPGEFLAAA